MISSWYYNHVYMEYAFVKTQNIYASKETLV